MSDSGKKPSALQITEIFFFPEDAATVCKPSNDDKLKTRIDWEKTLKKKSKNHERNWGENTINVVDTIMVKLPLLLYRIIYPRLWPGSKRPWLTVRSLSASGCHILCPVRYECAQLSARVFAFTHLHALCPAHFFTEPLFFFAVVILMTIHCIPFDETMPFW